MKAVLLIVILGLAAVSAASLKEEEYQLLFSKWIAQHGKKYTHATFFHRYTVFKQNMDHILEHNKGKHSYTLGMNAMGDLTPAEFKKQKTGFRHIKNTFLRSKNAPSAFYGKLAESMDWRAKGAVTPVKNQEQCGSCWAFSAVGAIEGAYQIAHKTLLSFSEQQFVDCAGKEGNQGCNGGLMDQAFQYVKDNKDLLCLEAEYPYKAMDQACKLKDGKCPDGKAETAVKLTGFSDVTPGDENALVAAINVGPVSVAIEADQSVFQFYKGGILDSAACGTQLDHGVLAVGYGTEGGKDYYIVKNSWGTSWGESGYIRMIRHKNECGISQAASYPHISA